MSQQPQSQATNWQTAFPELAAIQEPAVAAALAAARTITLDAGTTVFHIGSRCEAYLLVLSGNVRVQVFTETGRTAVLYHVLGGDSCVLTTSCLLGDTPYPADGITEEPTTALAIPKARFDAALNASAAMRRFVFANLGHRFAEVIGRMEEIAFGPIDMRLARTLLQLHDSGTVGVTHEELAMETGTVREVVSRNLKRFESRGWVQLGRGHIEIVDREALLQLAELPGRGG